MDKTVNATIIESIKKLLNYSLKDITYNYDTLTATEKSLITKDQFDELVTWLCVGENAQRSETVPNEGVDDGGPIDRQLSRIGDAGLERDIAAVVREALPNACAACGEPNAYLLIVDGKRLGCCEGSPACEAKLRATPRTGSADPLDPEPFDPLAEHLAFACELRQDEYLAAMGRVVEAAKSWRKAWNAESGQSIAEACLCAALDALHDLAAPCVSTDGNEQKGKVDHG